jgi:hypothetical protein
VGINPHNEHEDWDFIKAGNAGLPACSSATDPGKILSTLPRGMAHVPERRLLTEAEVMISIFEARFIFNISVMASRSLLLHQRIFATKPMLLSENSASFDTWVKVM